LAGTAHGGKAISISSSQSGSSKPALKPSNGKGVLTSQTDLTVDVKDKAVSRGRRELEKIIVLVKLIDMFGH
jgi:hypothetical protein